ncbi:hypothetical protein EX30DRAFT_64 [Ascodesmis nigricans]|uniref:BTB domain-containing protein n=1 Tax=Ascodesmis nigricans TaxID=341454 RepID=A0A4S2N585_9PEZI|nr:hypothetical protein EX30DRAFT_64 [Ascodesmis nigricans]
MISSTPPQSPPAAPQTSTLPDQNQAELDQQLDELEQAFAKQSLSDDPLPSKTIERVLDLQESMDIERTLEGVLYVNFFNPYCVLDPEMTLKCPNMVIKVHREILQIRAPHLAAIATNPHTFPKDYNSVSIFRMVQWIYHGEYNADKPGNLVLGDYGVDDRVTPRTRRHWRMINLADDLQIPLLRAQAAFYLRKSLFRDGLSSAGPRRSVSVQINESGDSEPPHADGWPNLSADDRTINAAKSFWLDGLLSLIKLIYQDPTRSESYKDLRRMLVEAGLHGVGILGLKMEDIKYRLRESPRSIVDSLYKDLAEYDAGRL